MVIYMPYFSAKNTCYFGNFVAFSQSTKVAICPQIGLFGIATFKSEPRFCFQ